MQLLSAAMHVHCVLVEGKEGDALFERCSTPGLLRVLCGCHLL